MACTGSRIKTVFPHVALRQDFVEENEAIDDEEANKWTLENIRAVNRFFKYRAVQSSAGRPQCRPGRASSLLKIHFWTLSQHASMALVRINYLTVFD
ncbi:hypothetical protein PV328_004535 [Microctonus aethiopoides]|uniref:Uncharacterized protein n=1 Tax=Microctonus aethiopoides TaxID=144406 RepID=A0AA39FAQ4_9HYME|nr:hypothetical protein PV328_004535 [Microctonus aethiopoides]